MTEKIARLRIVLQDIEPEIWRRVDVPLDLDLKSLHDIIQSTFEWQDYHLFEFTIQAKRYGVPCPEEDFGRKILNARLAKIETLVARGVQAFGYVYDMGDNWKHTITIEGIVQGQAGTNYPRFVDGARRGPPEDVGSVPGYYEFLKAVSSPRHREHRRMLEWYGGPYDPDNMDTLRMKLHLGAIAKRRHARKNSQEKRSGSKSG